MHNIVKLADTSTKHLRYPQYLAYFTAKIPSLFHKKVTLLYKIPNYFLNIHRC